MSNPIIEAVDIHKSYLSPEGSIRVLRGVSFQAYPGKSFSIQGESGSGKTTILNLLSLLERPDEGEVLWNHEPVSSRRNAWIAKRRGSFIGLVFQSFYLIPELNVVENVLIPKRILGSLSKKDKDRALALLKQVGLQDRLLHLPNQLSGGEMQRVAVARALMNTPSVIIADEPTGNLDENTGLDVMELLCSLCREEGSCLVLVTHNPAFAAQTDVQAVLRHGKLVIS